ncbi:zinc metalloproteinase nas-7-like [Mizuhopecten yessoensis]|uniref:zinc metalloproteinase nas-7-like n=1 Tax=Mizuhopecten yessoensis TaxID=6573 RepID=UPI000B45AFB9|nr:zinc metalloproteinase nas-7-like [Mizuhopecten yessoensis]
MACIKLYCLLFFFAVCSIYGDVSGNVQLRNVLLDHQRLWHTQTIHYAMSSNYDDNQRLLIEQAMRTIEQAVKTGGCACFSFREKNVIDGHYLYITYSNNGVCFTEDVGEIKPSRQHLYLADDCFNKRDIVSLLVVTMGLYPEHRRPDRDQYIQVHMDNIQDAARPFFNKIPPGDTDLLGLPYDYESITHYGPYQYAINTSLPTISTNVTGVSFGHGVTLSFYDVLKIQTLYRCQRSFGGNILNIFTQPPPADHYPQWFVSSGQSGLVYNNDRRCSKVTAEQYLATVLNGATMMSNFTLLQGNHCVGVGYCMASCYHDTRSYIELTTGRGISLANITSSCSCGQWQTQNVNFTADQGWSLNITAHVLSGGDLLALDSVVVSAGPCA